MNSSQKFEHIAPDVLMHICNLPIKEVNVKTPQQVIKRLKWSYYHDKGFRKHVDECFKSLKNEKRKISGNLLQRIFDLNLFYVIDDWHKYKGTTKPTGKALEHVASSLAKECGLDVEHVDLSFGDLLLSQRNKPVAIVECKVAIHAKKSALSYKRYLGHIRKMRKKLPDVTLILFGGCVPRPSSKANALTNNIRNNLKRYNCRLFILWHGRDTYDIDKSFHDFAGLLRKLGKRRR